MGILPHHAPLMAELRVGEIKVERPTGLPQIIATSGGFLMVENNEVTVLADSAELAQDIDVRRAEEARQRAEQRLSERAEGLDATRAQSALERALNRLKVAGQG
jgi:F-type H+-transporting ATPase subunit epsilon